MPQVEILAGTVGNLVRPIIGRVWVDGRGLVELGKWNGHAAITEVSICVAKSFPGCFLPAINNYSPFGVLRIAVRIPGGTPP
jgi:hypothetical protein